MPRRIAIMMVVMMAMLAGGCAAGNYGKVSRSAEVDGIFSSGAIPSGYRYYYIGEKTDPPAILGIRNDYTLQTRFWMPVNLDNKQMETWRTYFKDSTGWVDHSSRERLRFSGYSLLDPKGQEFGILYSIYPWIVSTFPGEKEVIVYPPEPYIKDPLLAKAQ